MPTVRACAGAAAQHTHLTTRSARPPRSISIVYCAQLSFPGTCIHGCVRLVAPARHAQPTRWLGSRLVARSKVLQGLDIPVGDDSNGNDAASQQAAADAAGRAQQESTANLLRELYAGRSIPEPYFGPLTLSRVKGKGWGLVATAPISAGDLILVSEPLAWVRGRLNQPPQPQDLQDQLRTRRYTPGQVMLYQLLYRGEERDMTVRAPRLDALTDVVAGESGVGDLRLEVEDPQELAEVINYNAYGDGSSDMLLARLRRQDAFSYLGLWPEFSFLNHSCCPNATHWVVGGRMLVRATVDIAPRSEVTVNYLGTAALSPLPSREQDLSGWGFTCNCMRCRNERRFEPNLTYMMQETGKQFFALQGLYEDAIAHPTDAKLDHLEAKLIEMASDAEEGMQEMAPDGQRLMWLRASLFDVYNLLAHVRRMKGPNSEDALASQAACVQIIESVAAGSDFHMLLTCQFVEEVNRVSGGRAHEMAEVQRLAFSAVKSRYGPVDAETFDRILTLGAQVVEDINIAEGQALQASQGQAGPM